MGVVRAYTMEARAARHFAEVNAEFLRRSLALARTQAGSPRLTGLIGGVGALVVLWVGGTAVADGRLSLGALVAFNGYLAYLAWPTMALGWTWSIVRRGLTSMTRLEEIVGRRVSRPRRCNGRVGAGSHLDQATLGQRRPARTPLQRSDCAAPSLRFSQLTFAYRGTRARAARRQLRGGAAARRWRVVGRDGKRQVHAGAAGGAAVGAAARDGLRQRRDVRDIPLADLRGALGYVPQEGFLFSRSIRGQRDPRARRGPLRSRREAAARRRDRRRDRPRSRTAGTRWSASAA